MCGIAGLVDVSGSNRPVPAGVLRRMADAIVHRGPDEDGYLERPGIGLANRRLSIVGLADGQQPIWNETKDVVTVFNGEFFLYPEKRQFLEGRGHTFRTHCDTEILPHLWEDFQEGFFEHLQGQFAFAVWDMKRQTLVIARDRFGICPLYWSRANVGGGEWLLFGSEIKALLASGLISPRSDLRGIDQVFNFFSVPGPATCFEGIQSLQPGQYLKIQFGAPGSAPQVELKTYWHMDFAEAGKEEDGDGLVDQFDKTLLEAVDIRLRADVPVVSYLSGGIDSSIVVAMAAKIRGKTVPTFTIQILDPKLDETSQAAVVSKHIGAEPIVVPVGAQEVLGHYAELTRAAEAPVVDTSCTALLMLARSVHQNGYKVALTGEGSDEWLAGYGWYKFHKIFESMNVIPGTSHFLRRGLLGVMGAPKGAYDYIARIRKTIGYHSAFQDIYGLMSFSRLRFYSQDTLDRLGDYIPYRDLNAPLDKLARWHPINRSLYWAGRIHLAGHLLSAKGDRIAMNSSVEARYPFLDEKVFNFLARIHPRWKMRGLREKYILRVVGERYLPKEVAWRKKGMFRAPLDSFWGRQVPEFVNQLVSPESLKKTGYFNPEAVAYWKKQVGDKSLGVRNRSSVELGLVGVVATQLWHHLFIDGSLADIPAFKTPQAPG